MERRPEGRLHSAQRVAVFAPATRGGVSPRARLHPVVGRVAMDVCVVEIGDADLDEGDEVTYFGGAGPAAQQVADWARITGLTPPEIVTAVGMHARREHVE